MYITIQVAKFVSCFSRLKMDELIFVKSVFRTVLCPLGGTQVHRWHRDEVSSLRSPFYPPRKAGLVLGRWGTWIYEV